jgi:DNA-binding NtrC family response regulator
MQEKLKALVAEARQGHLTLKEFSDAVSREFIIQTLDATKGNQVKAAKLLQVHRNTMRRYLQVHSIDARTVAAKKLARPVRLSPAEFRRA